MASRVRRDASELSVARSVMYSDAGFDVSSCGRYLALCELDPQAPPPAPAAPRPRRATPARRRARRPNTRVREMQLSTTT